MDGYRMNSLINSRANMDTNPVADGDMNIIRNPYGRETGPIERPLSPLSPPAIE